MTDDPRKKLEHHADTPSLPGARRARRVTLEEAVPGYAVRVPERGHAYKVITPLPDEANCFAATFASPDTPVQQRLLARCGATTHADEVLLFDLETTGLGNTPLFLIGAMSWEVDTLVIRQFLARDYGEEAAVIQLFLALATEKRCFITFNGTSFDLPMLYQRALVHGIPCIWHAHHFDLLQECRRIWRSELPNCQLQTLEQLICGHAPRRDDIPGEDIPAAYQAFVRNGNAAQMALILRHNLQDLLTMMELLTKLPPLEREAG